MKPDPPPRALVWHPSFRHYRLSQVTDDLYDAFRNAYLALESVLSDVHPIRVKADGRPAEAEGRWFKEALAKAGELLPLKDFVSDQCADPVDELFEELYKKVRTAIFHSKTNLPTALPQDSARRSDLLSRLDVVIKLYLSLTDKQLGIRPPSGGVTHFGFLHFTKGLEDNVEVYVTDASTPFKPDQETVNPNGGTVALMETRESAELERKLLRVFVGALDLTSARGLSHITKFAIATRSGGLLAAHELKGSLELSGVDRLEARIGVRARNVREPKRSYAV